jgi:hypothetical protein
MPTTILCDSDTDHDNRNVKFLLHYKALASYTTHSQVAEMYSESHKETQEQRLIQTHYRGKNVIDIVNGQDNAGLACQKVKSWQVKPKTIRLSSSSQ